ncbi:restriction endonuclease subunit S [Bacteroides thetaiotaomicron]|uniref:restriction endonuclease subunit S n=1 Tax=Bacteroides thetaiotaomicron TaxID=818 RepID=UPI001F449EC6|nr:restriction endonuclease subunit S [Bacteroides thetaiotaomicron]MCE9148264.1 restriction endonuclease subunit S [Bacteroides thetaiotaomicron]
MKLTRCKLGKILELQRGYDLPSSQMEKGDILVAGSNGVIGYHNEARSNHPCITVGRSGSVGKVHYYEQATWAHNTALFVKDFKGNDPKYLYYFLKNLHLDKMFDKGSSVVPSLDRKVVHSLNVPCHKDIDCQKRIAAILSKIDRKIELNRAINQNLEAMAKQLYDYWFVQFDFPNKDGRPYKSSGGKMVWNKKIKREIPEGWKEVTLNDFIDKNKGGDWGYDTPKDGTIKVGCVRGADIIKLNDVPTRHITSKHSDRLLEDGDIVIEISGGSPVQATGRVALITNGVIERNGGALVCSNFCQSFNMKKREFSEYFYYLWQNLYDNDNMFNFEGKTSGIKNFQTDVFLANYWFEVPEPLIETFHTIVAQYHLMIDQNIIENNNLIKQRDKLLPLLMNGQVSVNSDLSDD